MTWKAVSGCEYFYQVRGDAGHDGRGHGMTLVTRNVADFQTSGVAMINPWERQ
jgi:hypothetical protein